MHGVTTEMTKSNCFHPVVYIQGVPGVFWDVIVSVILNKNVYMNMCPIPNGFRDRAIWMYNRKIVDKKEILRVRTVSNTGIYCSSDRVGTCSYKHFCLEWPILWPPRIMTFPSGTPCIPSFSLSPPSSHKDGGLNPSEWGDLNPSSYCDVGRFFYGAFKFWAKLCRSLFKIM